MLDFLKPATHQKLLTKDKIDPAYKKLLLQLFLGIFIGYAGYYLVKKNFSLTVPDLVEAGFSKTELGFAMSSVSIIAYGRSKFFMASICDRSDVRKFLSLGLMLSAITMLLFSGRKTHRTTSHSSYCHLWRLAQ